MHVRQGYFSRTPRLRGRIRIFGDKGFITFKSEPGIVRRYEFEYEIPKHEAEEIISRFNRNAPALFCLSAKSLPGACGSAWGSL